MNSEHPGKPQDLRELFVATRNPGKLAEIVTMIRPCGWVLRTLVDRRDLPDPEEEGDTFAANALHKARELHRLTGLPTLADDSGLEVDALGGAPGVRSKRFSQEGTTEANNQLLLRRLEGVERRTARFRCVLALVTDAGEATVEGTCEGSIAHTPRGEGGFGYDPLFLPAETPGRSMAELAPEEKNRISHRGRAMSALPELLARMVGRT